MIGFDRPSDIIGSEPKKSPNDIQPSKYKWLNIDSDEMLIIWIEAIKILNPNAIINVPKKPKNKASGNGI